MAKNIAIAYSMKKKKLQQSKAQAAEGDVTKGYYRDQLANKGYGHKEKGVGRIASNKQEHQWKLDEIKEDKTDRRNLAKGGSVYNPRTSSQTTFDRMKKESQTGYEKGVNTIPGRYSGSKLDRRKNDSAHQTARRVLEELREDKTDRKNLAKGGKVQWGQIAVEPGITAKGVHKSYGKTGTSDAGILVGAANKMHSKNPNKSKYSDMAKDKHRSVLSELREDKGDRRNLAEGGAVDCPNCGYSEGGEVANDTDMSACEMPNEFDALVLSGGLDVDDDHDIVKRAMKRKYK